MPFTPLRYVKATGALCVSDKEVQIWIGLRLFKK